jgi:hypothetical protein
MNRLKVTPSDTPAPAKTTTPLSHSMKALNCPNCGASLRLNENKDFSYAEAQKDFGFSPLSFEEGIKFELESYND